MEGYEGKEPGVYAKWIGRLDQAKGQSKQAQWLIKYLSKNLPHYLHDENLLIDLLMAVRTPYSQRDISDIECIEAFMRVMKWDADKLNLLMEKAHSAWRAKKSTDKSREKYATVRIDKETKKMIDEYAKLSGMTGVEYISCLVRQRGGGLQHEVERVADLVSTRDAIPDKCLEEANSKTVSKKLLERLSILEDRMWGLEREVVSMRNW